MSRYYYDLHVHSCLSPCGDNDMTVNNIAGMAALKGLNIVALTDHNTCANCPAFFAACKRNGIIPVAGMELTTAEEIHLVCLFETLDEAMRFDSELEPYRMKLKNRVDIFGEQYILDENDNITAEYPYLLPPATSLPLEEACELARKSGALCYPAHIDRPSNGILGILGTFPESPEFSCIEFSTACDVAAITSSNPMLAEKTTLVSSDAHYLWDMSEAENFLDLDETQPYSSEYIRRLMFAQLKGNGARK